MLEVLLLLMKNEQEEVLQTGLPNDVHKYKANFQAEGSLLPLILKSTVSLVECAHPVQLVVACKTLVGGGAGGSERRWE